MKEIKSPFWRTIYEYGLITVSIWIMVVGIYFFKFPNHFAFGGITGFSTVVSQLTHWSASDFTSVTNTALLLLGFLFLGKGFGLKTVYATMVMSVAYHFLSVSAIKCTAHQPAALRADVCHFPSGCRNRDPL